MLFQTVAPAMSTPIDAPTLAMQCPAEHPDPVAPTGAMPGSRRIAMPTLTSMRLPFRLAWSATCSLACACSAVPPTAPPAPTAIGLPTAAAGDPLANSDPVALLDRIGWGATSSSLQAMRAQGTRAWLQSQLHPPGEAVLPAPVARQIAELSIQSRSMADTVVELEQRRRGLDKTGDEQVRKAARQSHQDDLNRLARDTSTRMLLRALYSPNQLQEQMTWFWFNHFNVFQGKHDERAMLADYEQTLRSHALGRFPELLSAVAHHPAMLVYLDNAQNAAKHVNENYAREMMELHTLGVSAGYTQRDVQELARVLTGFGVNRDDPAGDEHVPSGPHASDYRRRGLFEFHPNRHDYGDKQLLGTTVRGRGPVELDEVVVLLSRHPATARFISRRLAQFFVSDDPPAGLVERMALRFRASDGDIAQVLQAMFESPEFAASLHTRYKDPVHYVVSAVRLAYDDKPILNAAPMINWLHRLGEAPYQRQTPDGYPLVEAAWTGPGQLTARFEIARAIGSGSAGLFKSEGAAPVERPAFPQLSNALYFEATARGLAPATRLALDQAASPQEWNMLLLSSPEFMLR
jgi:uncharacterized protein (DUF1800 family)